MANRKKKKLIGIPKTVAEARNLFVLETGLPAKLKQIKLPKKNYIMTAYTPTGIPIGVTGFAQSELMGKQLWILWSRKSGMFLTPSVECLLKEITTRLKKTNNRIM